MMEERASRPGDAYWRLVEPYWDKVSIYDGPSLFETQFAAVPVPNRNLLAAHWCQSEVCNGGFTQFFENSTGVLAPEAESALRAIGMPEMADVVRSAIEMLGRVYPRERHERIHQLDVLGPRAFHDLEERFFKLVASEAGGWDIAADRYAAQGAGP